GGHRPAHPPLVPVGVAGQHRHGPRSSGDGSHSGMGVRMEQIRLGAGAGFAGDRIDPAVELAQYADLDYLIFECLGERTVAAGQARRREDAQSGYDPLLVARIAAVIEHTLVAGTTIITNGGSANPLAAADAVATMLSQRDLGR